MANDQDNLPEGTDKIIAGASTTGGRPPASGDSATGMAIRPATPSTNDGAIIGSGTDDSSLKAKLRSSGEKLSGQAADRARGLIGQGLERSSDALTNVSKLVGDTADGIDERLGPEYGDYARRAAEAIDSAAGSLASKNPDELIDDTRRFIKKSPGIALAGAAVIGFALARLLKNGLSESDDDQRAD